MTDFLDIIEYFLIGICIGSFLNVVIYRLPLNISVLKPRSFCPRCKTKISWRSNIPLISFLIQKGKCFSCGVEISFKYPLIEFLVGILFVIFSYSSPYFYSFNSNLQFINLFSWIFLSILIVISFIDLEHFWIPQNLINVGFLFGIINLLNIELFRSDLSHGEILFEGILGSLGAYFCFECIRILSKKFFQRDALGKGDSKLIAMIGLWLGPIGVTLCIGICYVFAAICLLFLFKFRSLKRGQLIPFAPFLSISGLVVWFFGNEYLIKILYGFEY